MAKTPDIKKFNVKLHFQLWLHLKTFAMKNNSTMNGLIVDLIESHRKRNEKNT